MRSSAKFLGALLFTATTLAGCRTTNAGKPPVYLIRVDAGDTLASIAVKYDTTWERIAALNNLSQGRAPKVGAVIRVEPGPGGIVAKSEGGLFARSVPARLPKHVKAPGGGNANNNNNNDAEFQEEDLPSTSAAKAAPEAGQAPKKGGLFFGGGGGSASNSSGLEWPLFGEVSSRYGQRGRKFHHGIDIRAKKGSQILAAGVGVVEFSGDQHGYGHVVIIRHANKLRTLYGHLSSIDVNVGDKVNHGTEIGSVGTSGNSSGPHLHFEIRNDKNQSIDPLTVMEKDKLLSSAH